MGGTTEYEMDIKGFYEFDNGGTLDTTIRRITSLLEFPLDVTIGGFSGIAHPIEDPNKWTISLKYLTNLSNPNNKMTDKDWDEIVTKFPYMLWSDTESDAEMSMTILDLEARFRIVQKSHMDISIIAGGRYQKIDQKMFGIDGWQKSFNDSLNVYNETAGIFTGYDGINGLNYQIEFKQFKIGLQNDIYLSNKITSQIKLLFAPASFEDIDDHVLRKKLSTANGDGNGYITGFNLRYETGNSKFSFIQLSTLYNYYISYGTQIQEWYGDDPSSDEDDTGNVSQPVPHTVISKQYVISLQIGIEF